ncbi:hypothetical protein MMC18_000119 [Xylographa bjoerkii]|nr:hypothetical protein [Xylographa bjoerkii]
MSSFVNISFATIEDLDGLMNVSMSRQPDPLSVSWWGEGGVGRQRMTDFSKHVLLSHLCDITTLNKSALYKATNKLSGLIVGLCLVHHYDGNDKWFKPYTADGINKALAEGYWNEVDAIRASRTGGDGHLVIKALEFPLSHPHNGIIASEMLQWGLEHFRKDKSYVFVVALPAGRQLFQQYGFKGVETIVVGLWTPTTVDYRMPCMLRVPGKWQVTDGSGTEIWGPAANALGKRTPFQLSMFDQVVPPLCTN